MNKKLIVLAVAGALAAPLTASAQSTASTVTIYGRVQASYDAVQIDQAAGTTNADRRQRAITDNYGQSRFGFAIKEDLGGGLNANAKIEFGFRPGTGTADQVREQWIGLSSKDWGSATFGRVHSVLKDFAGGTTVDPLNATALQARGSGGAGYAPGNGFGNSAFVDHAVRYESPTFGGGFSAGVLWVPSNATQADSLAAGAIASNTGGNGGANDYQIGLKYKVGTAGEIFGAYSVDKASNLQRLVTTNGLLGDDEKVWRIGGSWSFGNFKIAGQYDDIENALGANGGGSCGGGASGTGNEAGSNATVQCNTALNVNGDGRIFFLTGQYKMGNTTFIVQGGQTKADAVGVALTSVERKAKNITLGAIHTLSKRSSIFGGFQRVSLDGSAAANAATGSSLAGAIGATNAIVGVIQPDRSVWSLGMRHNF